MRSSLLLRAAFIGLGVLCQSEAATGDPLPLPLLAAHDPLDVAAELEKEGSLASLVKAVMLRRAYRDGMALVDIERGLEKLTAARSLSPLDAQAAADFLVEVLEPEEKIHEQQWQAWMHRYIRAMVNTGQAALRLRAQVRLASYLWEQSCPINGQDGACIERAVATGLCLRAIQGRRAELVATDRAHRMSPSDCALPIYVYRVHTRNRTLAALAQGLIKDALAQADSAQVAPLHPGDEVDEALAHARFLQAEPYFEAALAITRYEGAPATADPFIFDSSNRSEFNRTMRASQRWFLRRVSDDGSLLHPQPWFERPLAHAQTSWAVAAQSRLGQLYLDVVDQMTGCGTLSIMPPPPSGMSRAEWNTIFRDSSHCGSSRRESRYFARSRSYLEDCSIKAASKHLDTAQTRFCEESLRRMDPGLFEPQQEILPCDSFTCTSKAVFSISPGG